MVNRRAAMDPKLRDFESLIRDVLARLDRLERGMNSSDLRYSSLDDSTIKVKKDGELLASWGIQPDGNAALLWENGPDPSRPNTAELTPSANGLLIGWNGELLEATPSNFSHIRIHLSTVENFIIGDSNRVGTLTRAGVLPVVPLPQEPHYCVFIAVSLSGKESPPSIVAVATPGQTVADAVLNGIVDELALADDAVTRAKVAVGAIGIDEVDFDARDIGSIATFAQDTEPTGGVEGDLWADTNDGNKLYRYTSGIWEVVRDGGITAALQAAQEAQTDAATALNAATSAEAKADGAVTVFYTSTTPTAAESSIGDLWLNIALDNRLHRYSGTAWVLVDDQRTATALANAATAQSTADGKIKSFYQATQPVEADTGDIWYDTDAGNVAARYNGTTWTSLPAGSEAIQDDAITTSHIIARAIQAGQIAVETILAENLATDSVTARIIAALSVTADAIVANAIQAGHITAGAITADKLTAILILATDIILGNQLAQHVRINNTGLTQYASDGTPTFRIGQDPMGGNYLTIVDPVDPQRALASIAEDGSMSATRFSVTGGFTYDGNELVDLFNQKANGLQGWGSNGTSPATTSRIGLVELEVIVKPGRMYEFKTNTMFALNSNTGDAELNVHYTTNGTRPTISSTVLTASGRGHPGNPMMVQGLVSGSDVPSGRLRLLLSVGAYSGSVSVGALGLNQLLFWVTEIGVYTSPTGVISNGGGSSTPPKAQYITQWDATWHGTWNPGLRSGLADMVQGPTPGTSQINFCAFGFDVTNIRSVLTGATIDRCEMYIYINHAYYSSGGFARIRTHVGSPTGNYPGVSGVRWVQKYGKPQGLWIDVGTTVGNEFKNAQTNGFALDARDVSANLNDYIRVNGSGQSLRPKVKITYTK